MTVTMRITLMGRYDTIWSKSSNYLTEWPYTHHQWTNNPYVYHCQWFPGLLFLGLVSWACLTYLSAWVVFKWQWCDWTSTHPARNHHTTGQKAWPFNRLLFVISWAQIGLGWKCSTSTHKKLHFMAPHHPWPPPLCNHLWYWHKNYLKWQAIQLAVLCRVG